MSVTFQHLHEQNVSRAQRWHPGFPEDTDWNIADWSNAMCGEAGEAANVVKKIRRREGGFHDAALDGPPAEKLKHMLGHELADLLLYTQLLAHKAGVDLEMALIEKFNLVSEIQGFPERLSVG